MNSIGIRGIGSYLPQQRRLSSDLSLNLGFDLDFLVNKVGIEQRPVSGENESVVDMAVAACRQLHESHTDFDPKKIELVVFCTQTPDYQIPHASALLQDRLGLGKIAAFDIGLACSGFVYSLAVALSFMQTHGFMQALLVTSEAYTKLIQEGDRDTMALFGDGAAAVWLGPEPVAEVGNFTFGTDGAGHRALMVENGGSRHPGRIGHLHMNGKAIFNFVMHTMPHELRTCLDKNDLSVDQIDYFVFHQASKYVLDMLAKRLRLPSDKIFINLANLGNTVSSTIPLALRDMIGANLLFGKKVFVSGFGAGLSWASTILNFLPSDRR